MNISHPTCCLLLLGALVLPVAADTYLLKNGSRLDGRLLSETEDAYVLEVVVAAGIKDEKVVPKGDVVSVEKARQDFMAFEKLKSLLPTPDGLSVDGYEERIREVSAFTTAYPVSPRVEDALKMLVKLRSELKVVSNGGVKFDGHLLTAESREANAYEIDASIEERRIRGLMADGRHVEALRAFSTFEGDYAATTSYSRLLPSVAEAARKYNQQLSRMLQTYAGRVAQRTKGLETMSVSGRMDSEAAIQEQEELLQRRFVAEQEAQMKWVTPHPFSKPALEHGAKQVEAFLRELEGKVVKPPVDGGRMYREALAAARSGVDSGEFNQLVDQAEREGIPVRYIEVLRKAAGQATTSAGEQP